MDDKTKTNIIRTIEFKEWMVTFLEKYGKKHSQALVDEREFLEDWRALRDRYHKELQTIHNEYKAMVPASPDRFEDEEADEEGEYREENYRG